MKTIKDRIKELRRVSAAELIPNPKNHRRHPDAQVKAMRAAFSEIGIADAVLAREDSKGRLHLIDGHLRKEELGDSDVPVLVLDVTAKEADKLLATYDAITGLAEIDLDAFAALTEDMSLSDDLQAVVDAFIGDEETPELVEDEVPEPPEDPTTKKGDIWIMGNHRLICGDCRDSEDVGKLLNGKKINVAITSPPYASQRKYDESSGFKPIPPDEYVEWYSDVASNIMANLADDGSYFCNIKEHCDDGQRSLYVKDLTLAHVREWGWRFVDEFVWRNTKNGVPGGWPNRFKNAFEPIFHFSVNQTIKFRVDDVCEESNSTFDYSADTKKTSTGSGFVGGEKAGGYKQGMARPSNVLEIGASGESDHSAAYPVALPEFFIKAFSDTADMIYDPFLGSGTTLIAAEQLGRTCYGMEISPAYCDVIVKRWENLTGKEAKLG